MRSALLLGRGGRILGVINWQNAIVLAYFRGNGTKVFPLDFHDFEVRSANKSFKVPSVLILTGKADRHPHADRLSLTRQNVFMRDNFECQWCGKRLTVANRTIDHVYPTARNGTNTWRNVVASCVDCNNEKGMMTGPEYEKVSGKRLRRKPFVPGRETMFRGYLDREGYESWEPYLQKAV